MNKVRVIVANWPFVTYICGMKQSELESLGMFSLSVCVFSQVSLQLPQQLLPASWADLLHSSGQRLWRGQKESGPRESLWGRLSRAGSTFISGLTRSSGREESGCDEEWMSQPFLNHEQKEFTEYVARVNPLGIKCTFQQPFKASYQISSMAFMKSCTLKPVFSVLNIIVLLYMKPLHSDCVQEIYSHIVQINCMGEKTRSLHECVQAQSGEKKPEITLFP